jgi:hypothetical protein
MSHSGRLRDLSKARAVVAAVAGVVGSRVAGRPVGGGWWEGSALVVVVGGMGVGWELLLLLSSASLFLRVEVMTREV